MTDTRREEIENAIWNCVDEGTFEHGVNSGAVVANIATSVLSAITPAPVAGWRGMESAPKDGTEVLLYTPSGIAIGVWEELEEDCPDQPGHNPGWYGEGRSCDPVSWGRTEAFGFVGPGYLYEEQNQPTHWMPLPPAPGEPATEQPSVKEAARVLLDYLPNYAMENAALESRACDDEGEFASLSDLLDFSGQNKAYTVVREALTAALRSLAQEGE